MKKAFRRLSLAVSFAVLALLLPLAGNGVPTVHAANGFNVEDGVLTEYNGPGGAVTVPNYVTSIGSYAFENCTGVTAVTIPSTVTSIGRYAFQECSGLTKVTMANSVTSIEDYAFLNCTALSGITIPKSVTNIGEGVFSGCTAMKSISVPNSVKRIGDSAFLECSGLTGVSLPDSITVIGYCTFANCTGLKSITIPKSVTGIDTWAFQNCTGLTDISIPNSVTGIGYCAFSGCIGLKTLVLPDSLTKIDAYAFENCTGLTSVSMPDSLATIGRGAFLGCKGMTAVTVPSSVTSIENGAFEDCTGLKTVTILTRRASAAENDVFSGCSAVTDVYYAGSQSEWLASGFDSDFEYPVKVHFNSAAITAQPRNRSIVLGQSVTVSVSATGNGLKYQWYYKKSGQTSWSVWNARTHASETCTPNATWDGIQLYCKVTDSTGRSVKSNTATVRVLSIATQPKSQTVAKGSSLTVSVKATGSGLKYQWYYKKSGQTSWSVWNSRTHASETVVPNDTWDGIQLYCKVTDGAGHSVKSDAATVTLASGPVITSQPRNQYIILGKPVTVTVSATGSGLKYQWYYRKKGQTSWSVWNARTHASETCTPNATWDGIQLYCKVTNGNGRSVNSSAMSVSVLSISTQPTNKSFTVGNAVTLSLKATGAGLQYQWYYKKTGQSSFSVWNGRTHASETVSPNSSWNGIQLYCKVTDSAGNCVKSNTITVTVK